MEPKSQSPSTTAITRRSPEQGGRGFVKPQRDNPFKNDFRPHTVLTNYYAFTRPRGDPNVSEPVQKYHVAFEPQVADTAHDLRRKLIKLARPNIQQQLNGAHFLFKNTVLLSNGLRVEPMTTEVELDATVYQIKVRWVSTIEADDINQRVFYRAFFERLARGIKFTTLGSKYYDMQSTMDMSQYGLAMMRGFSAVVGMFDAGTYLKIDVSHRVLNNTTVLQEMVNIRQAAPSNFQNACNQYLVGKIVLTAYNNRCHKIARIDWDSNPSLTFSRRPMPGETAGGDDVTTSVSQYMAIRYNIQSVDPHQPLLVSVDQKTSKESYLLPQLSHLTGLTDQHRADHNLMKEMAAHSNMNAESRLQAVSHFLGAIRERCVETLKYWNLQIQDTSLQVEGKLMHPGRLSMKRDTIDLTQVQLRELDRKLQTEMLVQPPLLRWCIVHSDRDREVLGTLEREFQQAASQYRYHIEPPKKFPVRGSRFEDWSSTLECLAGQSVDMVVLLLPGRQKKGQHYDELKKLLNEMTNIPSQVVLVETIRRGKNIKSIVSKILVQMCAKVGGCPWSQAAMPFAEEPTMVCAIDLFHKPGKTSVLAFLASYDPQFARYFSHTKPMGQLKQEAVDSLAGLMEWALQEFKKKNGVYPVNVILYRDGVSDSQQDSMAAQEIQQIEQALARLPDIKFVYISVNKRISTRLFSLSRRGPDAPSQGLVVDSGIVKKDPALPEKKEFFIVSQAAIRGVAQPTHYVVLRSTVKQTLEELELFTYRICYLYYNVTGAISEPAPIRYAHRLSNVVGDAPGVYQPNAGLSEKLYFL